MSSNPTKVLKVYYKGTCQELAVADGTPCEDIFEILKRCFRIKESLENFFFQDSEGRLLVLPRNLPTELSVFLYVREDNQSTAAPPTDTKWKFICTKGTEPQLVNGTHYSPINSPNERLNPSIISSINFSQGKHYTIIKVDSHGCGWIGFGLPGSPPEYFNPGWHCGFRYNGLPESELPTFIYTNECDYGQLAKLAGIAIDYDTKTGYFLQVNPDNFVPTKIVLKVTDLPSSILIFAGIKGWSCIPSPHTGITLVKDSLPFPDLSKFSPEKTCSWLTDQVHKV